MFGFNKGHKTITVEFYEQDAPKPFAKSIIPIEQLPDTFAIKTTLHIAGEDWAVSDATPLTKAEFRTTGKVSVRLYKAKTTTIAPGELLYSLPTISNDIAALEDAPSLENVLVVHEDDWRQRELVSRAYRDQIRSEMEAIKQIYDTQREASGFRKLHVRRAIPAPLSGARISLTELMAELGAQHLYSGAAFDHVAAVIRRGFAFRGVGGWTIWGQCSEDETASFICLHPAYGSVETGRESAMFDAFLAARGLLLVDWIRMAAAESVSGLK